MSTEPCRGCTPRRQDADRKSSIDIERAASWNTDATISPKSSAAAAVAATCASSDISAILLNTTFSKPKSPSSFWHFGSVDSNPCTRCHAGILAVQLLRKQTRLKRWLYE
jgi:hypothetical protein